MTDPDNEQLLIVPKDEKGQPVWPMEEIYRQYEKWDMR